MGELNKYFDKIYVINLDRRHDRWLQVQQELDKHGITAQRVVAVDGNTLKDKGYRIPLGAAGLIDTIVLILQDAKEDLHDTILILEDDVVFSGNINEVIDQYMAAVPVDWDMLYFSGNHNGHVRNAGIQPPVVINEKLLRIRDTYSTHCIGIRSNMFDTIIETIKYGHKPLDVYYADLQKTHNVYCFNSVSPLATQRVGHSDIINAQADYTHLIS